MYFIYRNFYGIIVRKTCPKVRAKVFQSEEYETLNLPVLPYQVLTQLRLPPFLSLCFRLGSMFRDYNKFTPVSVDTTSYFAFVASSYLQPEAIPATDCPFRQVFWPNWGTYARVGSRKMVNLTLFNQPSNVAFHFMAFVVDTNQAIGFDSMGLVLGSEFMQKFCKSVEPNNDRTAVEKLWLLNSDNQHWWLTWEPKRLYGKIPYLSHYTDPEDFDGDY